MNQDQYLNAVFSESKSLPLGKNGCVQGAGTAIGFPGLQLQPAPTTIADTIENRLVILRGEIDRLQTIKKKLSEPNGILSVSTDDLYFVLR